MNIALWNQGFNRINGEVEKNAGSWEETKISELNA